MCGEQSEALLLFALRQGSPPRVRGTELALDWFDARGRITPACAGNSCPRRPECAKVADHPRVCGEQSATNTCSRLPIGSPPRVRGTVVVFVRCSLLLRITPACAGNSMISKTLDGERCLSWPHDFSCNYDANYFEQLTSEKRTNTPRGVRWELLPGRRNEALDCRIYAMYAAHLLLNQRGAIASIMDFEKTVPATTEESSAVEPVHAEKPKLQSSGTQSHKKFRPL